MIRTRQDRLKEVYEYLREHSGIHTQADFAKVLKITRPALSSAINGNESYLTDNLFKRVCAAYQGTFNLDYLLTGNGDLLTKKEPETAPIDKQQDALTYAAIQVGKMMADLSNSIASVREFQKKLEEHEAQLEHMTATLTDRIAQLDKLTAALSRQNQYRIPDLEPLDIAAEPLKKHAE